MLKHSEEYAPSGSHRWLHCPGSLRLIRTVPKKIPSVYALEGSAAHLLGERSLTGGFDPVDKVNSDIRVPIDLTDDYYETKVSDVMATAVQLYVDVCRTIEDLAVGGSRFVEKELDLSWLAEDFFGTGDHVIILPNHYIEVTDLKYGAGVVVEVEENSQLMLYGLGALGPRLARNTVSNKFNVKEIRINIVQPRAPHPMGPVRSWKLSVQEMYAWMDDILIPAIAATKDPKAPFIPGDWCRWCEALEVCPEMRHEIEKKIDVMFGDDLVPARVDEEALLNPLICTAEQLDRILSFSKVFQEWINRFHEEAVRRLKDGSKNAPKEWKLVAGKTARTWKDEAALVYALKRHPKVSAYTESFVKSPAQLENEFKLNKLNTNILAEFIDRKPGQPLLVHKSDKRPALPSLVDIMFGD